MEQLEFPVTFDLRVIYLIDSSATINADLMTVFARHDVPCAAIEPGSVKPGSRYGRLGARVTFKNAEQMRAAYADIGALSYIKSLI